jgi:hypothetical protein
MVRAKDFRTLPMKIPALPFTVTDWSQVAATTHPGETGQALWRTLNIGDVRVRMVEYTAGYLADHWYRRSEVPAAQAASTSRDFRSVAVPESLTCQCP